MNIKAALMKPAVALAALAAIGGGAGVAALASADTAGSSTTGMTTPTSATGARPQHMPGVRGKITAISGNTLTVEDQGFGPNATATTYTVDASSASIVKIAAPATKGAAPTETALSVSSLAVGDEISAQGTVSGTSVTATKIIDGMGFGPGMGRGFMGMGGRGRGTMGTVSAISGNTITLAGDNGTTYTVDASSAKVSKTIEEPVSSIQVGDKIGVDGTVSGTSVTASHIMDGIPQMPAPAPAQTH